MQDVDEIDWGVFASHHGDSICDGGAAHGQRYVDNEPKRNNPPPKNSAQVVKVLENIKGHTAETIEGAGSLPFTKVQTMEGIRKHFSFKFRQGNVVIMYTTGMDSDPSLAYQVTDDEAVTPSGPYKKVKRVDPTQFV